MSDSDAGDLFPKPVLRPRPRPRPRIVISYRANRPRTSLRVRRPNPDHSSDHDSHSSSHNDAASAILNAGMTLDDSNIQSSSDNKSGSGSSDEPVGEMPGSDKKGRHSQMGRRSAEVSLEPGPRTPKFSTRVPPAVVPALVGESQARSPASVHDSPLLIEANLNLKRRRSPSENDVTAGPKTPRRYGQGVANQLRAESLPNVRQQKRRRILAPAFELDVRSDHAPRPVNHFDDVVREVGKMMQNSLDRQTEVLSAILEVIRGKNE